MTEADKEAAANEQKFRREQLARPHGGAGLRTISDTALHSGLTAYAITPLEDTVFAILTAADGFSITGKTGRVCPAGIPIFARVTAIQLTSGEVDVNETG